MGLLISCYVCESNTNNSYQVRFTILTAAIVKWVSFGTLRLYYGKSLPMTESSLLPLSFAPNDRESFTETPVSIYQIARHKIQKRGVSSVANSSADTAIGQLTSRR
jgi:hypothetical protein